MKRDYIKTLKEYALQTYGFLHTISNSLYNYQHKKYGEFPGKKETKKKTDSADFVIYCFWTGDNEMSHKRKENLAETIQNVNVPVVLVTPKNLSNYIKDDFPLHPAYPFLSDVHKSDYLRCYFMHHWGGGYTDVKKQTKSWMPVFESLNVQAEKIAAGYREFYWGTSIIQNFESKNELKKLNNDLKLHYAYLLGNCAFIFKSYSNFTEDWITDVHKRLDENLEELKENPGNILGDNKGYPLPWTYILGQVFHPLCLKYHKYLIFSNNLKPVIKDYR